MGLLDQKVAIITGGAKVSLADFNEEALNTTVEEFKEQGFEALGVRVNIAVEEDAQRTVDDTVAHFDKVDILVNCAGVLDKMQAAHNVEDEIFTRVMDINFSGVMRGTRKVLPLFMAQGSGVIVNLSSITGLNTGRGGFTYAAAKHAV